MNNSTELLFHYDFVSLQFKCTQFCYIVVCNMLLVYCIIFVGEYGIVLNFHQMYCIHSDSIWFKPESKFEF